MRAKNFFLLAQTYTGDGVLGSFGVTGSNSEIGATNFTFQSAVASGSNGSYNLFVSDRTVSAGSAAFQFSKSAVSASTTDYIDVVAIVARG